MTDKENKSKTKLDTVIKSMMTTIVGVRLYGIISDLLEDGIESTQLWITSPSGKTTVELPFYTALRVIRKRNWTLTEVEPIRHLSRWEHFKLAIGKKAG